ncbi:MAG: DUF452 family protein [Chlorobium sp.]|nr:DUF452 family protein [Chlorobium sp.]
MKEVWLRKTGAEELVLFFSGWGMDSAPAAALFARSVEQGFRGDMVAFHDYRSLQCSAELCRAVEYYPRRTLLAWSLGVWVAERSAVPSPHVAVAVNGTPCPRHAVLGIEPAVFDATLESYSEENKVRFNRRMCGSREVLRHFTAISPTREAADQQEELRRIREALLGGQAEKSSGWSYSKAIIGLNDAIFLPQSQRSAWEGTEQRFIAEMPHWPFFHQSTIMELTA